MRRWHPTEELRSIFERLCLWYTIDEMARLLGRPCCATRKKLNEVGVEVLWRDNNGGKPARRWSRGELNQLYDLAGRISQEELAQRLNRSRRSIIEKARELGIAWRPARRSQGFVSAKAVGELAGVHMCYAAAVASSLFRRTAQAHGHGSGRRYYLDRSSARKLMAALRPGRVDWVDRLFIPEV